ncbi:MAG: AMP-binding protein [Chloroflexota bacterium]|nr:AMP-binding protein [Chloroflexota bacterium]
MYPPEVYRSYLTPLRFLQRSAAVFRQKPAVVYGDRSWTYPELAARVNRLASALRAAGVEKGTASPTWSRTSRHCWKAISGCRSPVGFWWPSTPG